MTITIRINTGDAACQENYDGEVRAIVQDAARRVVNGERAFKLYDSNGNNVGTVKVTGK